MIHYFTAHTINCVCHSIRSMLRVLGIYNFGPILQFQPLDFLTFTAILNTPFDSLNSWENNRDLNLLGLLASNVVKIIETMIF